MKAPKEYPIGELSRLLSYNPNTGDFFWRVRPAEMFKTDADAKRWNINNAFKKAGSVSLDGYVYIHFAGKPWFAHRLAYALFRGRWPQAQIDHENGDGSDNRIKNLRVVSHATNAKNQRMQSRNKIGVCGVYETPAGKFRVRIGKPVRNLGTFDTLEEAAAARKAAEIELGYHPNHGRKRK